MGVVYFDQRELKYTAMEHFSARLMTSLRMTPKIIKSPLRVIYFDSNHMTKGKGSPILHDQHL